MRSEDVRQRVSLRGEPTNYLYSLDYTDYYVEFTLRSRRGDVWTRGGGDVRRGEPITTEVGRPLWNLSRN